MRAKPLTAAPSGVFASFLDNRILVWRLAVREIEAEFKGTLLGNLWAVLQPLLMLGVYFIVFKIVLRASWHGEGASDSEFALILFCGLTVFGLFSDMVNRAPRLVLENSGLVKKTVFPLEILPWAVLLRALVRLAVSFAILLVAQLVLYGPPPLTVVALPLVLLPLCLLCLGLTWLLASLGVYLRDLSQLVTLGVSAMMFLSPVFYPLSAVPSRLRDILALNPLAVVIEMARDVVIRGYWPAPFAIGLLLLGSFLLAWLGYLWFAKTRHGFSDVV